jgi:hypothetical protein
MKDHAVTMVMKLFALLEAFDIAFIPCFYHVGSPWPEMGHPFIYVKSHIVRPTTAIVSYEESVQSYLEYCMLMNYENISVVYQISP